MILLRDARERPRDFSAKKQDNLFLKGFDCVIIDYIITPGG